MASETEKFRFHVKGASDDDRTNKWNVNCKKCDKWFEPPTTMMAVHTVVCIKCGTEETINYNNLE